VRFSPAWPLPPQAPPRRSPAAPEESPPKPPPRPGAPTAWLPYIGVDDLKASTDKAESLGAKVIMREQPVPGHGSFSIIIDPTGANIALWQAKSA